MHCPFEDAEKQSFFDHLATHGWAVTEAVPSTLWRSWAARIDELESEGHLRAAGIGQTAVRVERTVRGDRIHWLEKDSSSTPDLQAWSFLDGLRQSVAREMFLSTHEFEAHYAAYPPGSGYDTHVDRGPENGPGRVLSLIAYLNENWAPEDGGALELFDPTGQNRLALLRPTGGRLVVFRSELFPHRVLPAARRRKSLTA